MVLEYKIEKRKNAAFVEDKSQGNVTVRYHWTHRVFEREKVAKGKRAKPWKEIHIPKGEVIEG